MSDVEIIPATQESSGSATAASQNEPSQVCESQIDPLLRDASAEGAETVAATAGSDKSSEDNEFGKFADRRTEELTSTSSSKDSQLTPPLTPTKKRKYVKSDDKFTDAVKEKLDKFLLGSRRVMLIDLNKSRLRLLQDFYFKDLSGEEKDFAISESHRRFFDNVNTWKSRIITAMENWIRVEIENSKPFKITGSIQYAQSILADKFEIDSYLNVFQFAKGHINLRGKDDDTKKVIRWCKIIFVDLGACMKMYLNKEYGIKRSDPSDNLDYTKKLIMERFDNYGTAKEYDKFRPSIGQVSVFNRVKSSEKKRQKVSSTTDSGVVTQLYIPDDD
ncbi:unnamed protein product [Clonostachys byssicola]|uniref:Uncharacterized protein n=1 Tax=Clonostachys byssicola TaxID=160290 RepID=A0A9N9URL1_9HYPO|nr:unnamed protein product [Clonostachys byssicola]